MKPPKPPQHAPDRRPAEDLEGPQRRNFIYGTLAVMIGGILSVFPFAAGLLVFLDPIIKSKKATGSGHSEGGEPFRRVASVDSLPADGTPVQVPVIADKVDAWSRDINTPIGAVYLIRHEQSVQCFNAICPHAGCFVGFAAERKCFQCPCHTSSFQLDGARIMPSPSPRDMDPLEVDPEKLKTGEVWVRFVNYYPGKEDREAKE